MLGCCSCHLPNINRLVLNILCFCAAEDMCSLNPHISSSWWTCVVIQCWIGVVLVLGLRWVNIDLVLGRCIVCTRHIVVTSAQSARCTAQHLTVVRSVSANTLVDTLTDTSIKLCPVLLTPIGVSV